MGEDATFDCVIEESLPYASIKWQKDGKPFTGGEVSGPYHIQGTKATSSALSVRSLTFSSAGWYGCIAVNPLLPSQPQHSKKAYLTVLRKYINFSRWLNWIPWETHVHWPSGVVRKALDREVQGRTMAGVIVWCSWARHFTLTVPLSDLTSFDGSL